MSVSPSADSGLTPIPDGVSDEKALLLGDILASGYFGAELCAIRPGDTVAVHWRGAGRSVRHALRPPVRRRRGHRPGYR